MGCRQRRPQILSVTESTIRFTETIAGATAGFSGAIVSRLVPFRPVVRERDLRRRLNRRIVRADGSSWPADGFLKGQRAALHDRRRHCGDFKMRHPRRATSTKDESSEFTSEGASFSAGSTVTSRAGSRGDLQRRRRGANAWYRPGSGSSSWSIPRRRCRPAARASGLPGSTLICFPSWRARWPSRGRDHGRPLLRTASSSAASATARFGIPPQRPKSQIDVLNIFNDSSQADGSGTLSSTTRPGSARPRPDLPGTHRPSARPRPSPAASPSALISFVTGSPYRRGQEHDRGLNLLPRPGQRSLTITGTLVPPGESTRRSTYTGALNIAPVAPGAPGSLSRAPTAAPGRPAR